MRFRSLRYFLKEGISNLARNKLMVFAALMSVTATLIILGIFLTVLLNIDFILSNVESKMEIKAFLKDDLTTADIDRIGNEIKNMEGVKEVTFESKQEALENFRKQLGDRQDLLAGLEINNPMPQSYIVKVENPGYLDDVAQKLKSISGVEVVKYGKDVADKLIGLGRVIRIIGLVIIGILILISVFIIFNTIKLTVFARRREINIMKYIGATDWFIKWPFIIEGTFIGLIGAIISFILISLMYVYLGGFVENKFFVFEVMAFSDIFKYNLFFLLAFGILIGFTGSLLSVRKFLRV